jgi:hypothetical protein
VKTYTKVERAPYVPTMKDESNFSYKSTTYENKVKPYEHTDYTETKKTDLKNTAYTETKNPGLDSLLSKYDYLKENKEIKFVEKKTEID